jgi:hypothetical protein
MQRGILRQFRGARDVLDGPPLSLFPAEDLLCLCFEVLEATGKSTEDTLAGRGFYSPEGFPFSNMYLAEALHGLRPQRCKNPFIHSFLRSLLFDDWKGSAQYRGC